MVLFPFYGLRKQGPQICWCRANVEAETWTQVFRVQVECPFRCAVLRAQVHANKNDQVTRSDLWYSPSRRILESTHAIREIVWAGPARKHSTDGEGGSPLARSAPGLGFLISKETTDKRTPKSSQHQADENVNWLQFFSVPTYPEFGVNQRSSSFWTNTCVSKSTAHDPPWLHENRVPKCIWLTFAQRER